MPRPNKPHQKYFLEDGTLVPGVTTVLGVLNKPFLVQWSNKLGLEGVKVSEYVDNLADIGTLAHAMIEAHLAGKEADMADYSKNQIDKAETCVLKFLEWEKQNKVKILATEMQMVSKKGFGGTCDLYCELNGVKTLVDLKTSKAIYDEMYTQVAAYKMLLEEAGNIVEDVRILRIGRDESEGFSDCKVPKIALHERMFLACLEVYNIGRQLKKKEA